jgi:hypothetical protein
MPTSIAEYYRRLTRDDWRIDHPYSSDVNTANDVLLDPFVQDPERRVAIDGWFQRFQPCLFGRLAAKRDGIHYCFLSTEDLLRSDTHIRNKIATSKRLWKQRAFRGDPKHGFVLLVCDRKITAACPDENLRQFAIRLQRLAFGAGKPDMKGNRIVDEWLFLRHPATMAIVKFVFSVDFFASGGDGRWWQDHRIPGGMAFTANSLGHMVRRQEWYEDRTDRIEWGLKTAMLTIESAAKDAAHGPATYLLNQSHGRPIRPYSWTNATSPADLEKLKGKDCGSYGGFLHTDHCVRPEFFEPRDTPVNKEEPWLMDFTYIFDPAAEDHLPFMIGHAATEAEVEAELGPVGDKRFLGGRGG